MDRNDAIRARRRERWERLDAEGALERLSGSPEAAAEDDMTARSFTAEEEQEQWYSMLSGASFRNGTDSTDLYYETIVERAILKVAKWTKDTPTVDKLFRPLDAIVDAVLTSSWGRSVDDLEDARGMGGGGRRAANAWKKERRRKYPLPVAQGTKYPLKLLDGSLRSRQGTIYAMSDKPGLGVKKKRKELRLNSISAAWYGDQAFPWLETVTDEDGTWIRVGRNVTADLNRRIKKGVLIVPLPFDEHLGDPCPGTDKALLINYTNTQNQTQTCLWDDGSLYTVSFLQAIRATYSPYV